MQESSGDVGMGRFGTHTVHPSEEHAGVVLATLRRAVSCLRDSGDATAQGDTRDRREPGDRCGDGTHGGRSRLRRRHQLPQRRECRRCGRRGVFGVGGERDRRPGRDGDRGRRDRPVRRDDGHVRRTRRVRQQRRHPAPRQSARRVHDRAAQRGRPGESDRCVRRGARSGPAHVDPLRRARRRDRQRVLGGLLLGEPERVHRLRGDQRGARHDDDRVVEGGGDRGCPRRTRCVPA